MDTPLNVRLSRSVRSLVSQIYTIFSGIIKRGGIYYRHLRQQIREAFRVLPIKIKLSFIIGLIVVLVISILSFIILQSEKRVLRQKLDEICNLSAKNLSQNVRYNLLLERYEDIKVAILEMMKSGIAGLEYAWVIDREGVVVAHSDLSNTNNKTVSPEQLPILLNLTDAETRETESHYEYYYPIFVTKKDEEEERKILIGVTGIGFSKEVIWGPIGYAQKLILRVALLIIVVSVLGIYFLAQRMAFRIQALSEGARWVGRGNLDVKIPVTTRDELGRLAEEFNHMIMQLREKFQMQKFVSKMTRQMIKKRVATNSFPMGSERRDITILFSDVRSFSAVAQELEPEEVVELINIYLELQSRIIEEHGGIIDKFMGDQVMAVFEGGEMIKNALWAAVEIQKSIRKLNRTREKDGKMALNVGIGLNYGPAVVGNIGSKDRMDYTVVGNVVNLASHLCNVAKAGQIITSLPVYQKIKGIYPAVKLESIAIKGRSDPIEICEIDYMRDVIM